MKVFEIPTAALIRFFDEYAKTDAEPLDKAAARSMSDALSSGGGASVFLAELINAFITANDGYERARTRMKRLVFQCALESSLLAIGRELKTIVGYSESVEPYTHVYRAAEACWAKFRRDAK